MAALGGGLDVWPYGVSRTEELARFSISQALQQNLSHWQALARLVDTAAQERSPDGKLPSCLSEERTQRIVGFTADVDTHSLTFPY